MDQSYFALECLKLAISLADKGILDRHPDRVRDEALRLYRFVENAFTGNLPDRCDLTASQIDAEWASRTGLS